MFEYSRQNIVVALCWYFVWSILLLVHLVVTVPVHMSVSITVQVFWYSITARNARRSHAQDPAGNICDMCCNSTIVASY